MRSCLLLATLWLTGCTTARPYILLEPNDRRYTEAELCAMAREGRDPHVSLWYSAEELDWIARRYVADHRVDFDLRGTSAVVWVPRRGDYLARVEYFRDLGKPVLSVYIGFGGQVLRHDIAIAVAQSPKPAIGADRGGGIVYLWPSVARAPPRPLNGHTLGQRRSPNIRRQRSKFSDPRAWGQLMVGTRFQYRTSQVLFVVTALAIVAMFLAGSKRAPHDVGWWINFVCICVFVLNAVIILMLRVLRALMPPTDDARGFEVVTTKDGGAAAD